MKEAPGPWFPGSLAAAHHRLVNGDQSGLVTAAAAHQQTCKPCLTMLATESTISCHHLTLRRLFCKLPLSTDIFTGCHFKCV